MADPTDKRFPWIGFIVVQILLAGAWWYVALWITLGVLGLEGFSGVAQWLVFFGLVALAVLVGAGIVKAFQGRSARGAS